MYPYRVELDNNVSNGRNNLDDELFVAEGIIDRYYKSEGVFKFGTLEFEGYLNNLLLMEDGSPLYLEDNQRILLE